jgi:hypothetical protein
MATSALHRVIPVRGTEASVRLADMLDVARTDDNEP